jgi:hypothetical protein
VSEYGATILYMVCEVGTFFYILFVSAVVVYASKYEFFQIEQYFVRLFLFLCIRNVIFVYIIHMYSFPGYFYYFHCIFYVTSCVSCIYYVLRICRHVFIVLYYRYMYVETYYE